MKLTVQLCAAALVLAASAARADLRVEVSALIDGRSILQVQGNQLWWHHLDYAAPGLWSGNDVPTTVGSYAWYPQWPGYSGEVRCGGCESTRLDLGTLGLQIGNAPLKSIEVIRARESLTVMASPTAANGFLTQIDFNDDADGGGDTYTVALNYGPSMPGLVSHWKADGDATDSEGNNPGSLAGTTSYVAGEEGQAFHFAAGNFAAPTAGMPTGSADRTIAGWIYIDETPGAHGAGENFFFGYGAFGSWSSTYQLGTSGMTLFFSQWGAAIMGPTLQAKTWYHVAATTQGGVTSLWLNGEVQSSGALGLSTPASSQFYMGQIPGDGDRRLVGSVDDVYVFDRALSHDEIGQIMAGTAPAAPVVTSSPARNPDNSAAFAGTAAPGSTLHVRDAGALVASVQVSAAGAWAFDGLAPRTLADGPHALSFSVSAGGAESAATAFSFVLWTEAPQLAITSPAAGTFVASVLQPLSDVFAPGYAPPSGVQLASIAWALNGRTVFAGAPGAALSIDLSYSLPGAQTVSLSAQDSLGNADAAPFTSTFTYAPDLATVQSLVCGGARQLAAFAQLEAGAQTSLCTKLANARAAQARGSSGAAANLIGAFVHEVDADVRSGRLAASVAAIVEADAQYAASRL